MLATRNTTLTTWINAELDTWLEQVEYSAENHYDLNSPHAKT
jgi:hypothetical protein